MECLLKRIKILLIAIYHHVYWCMVHSLNFACYRAGLIGDVLSRQLLRAYIVRHSPLAGEGGALNSQPITREPVYTATGYRCPHCLFCYSHCSKCFSTSVVRPLLKRVGLDHNCLDNYRPIYRSRQRCLSY